MKTKAFTLDVKAVADDGTFEGYASTFGGAPDSYGDVVLPGAFVGSLAKHRREGTMPLMLWNHKAGELPIGNWLDLAEDGKGLWAKGQADLDDPVGVRVHRSLKRKAVRGLSIGYETIASETDQKKPGVNFLKELDLWEISPVNFPANRRATVTEVKSERMEEFARRLRDGDPLPIKEFEDILREAGVPKAMAVQIASVGYAKAIRSESEGDVEAKAAISSVQSALDSLRTITHS
jgi:HK97 family phage prohead protease